MRKMIDMAKDAEEMKESMPSIAPMSEVNKYPYGLCICLTNDEIEKLDLDDDVEAGDMMHGFFMAKVTSVSKNDTGDGQKTRVEMQIVAMGVEDENAELEIRKKLSRSATRAPY